MIRISFILLIITTTAFGQQKETDSLISAAFDEFKNAFVKTLERDGANFDLISYNILIDSISEIVSLDHEKLKLVFRTQNELDSQFNGNDYQISFWQIMPLLAGRQAHSLRPIWAIYL